MSRHRDLMLRGIADLRRGWRTALGFHVLARFAGFAIAIPLLTLAFRSMLAASGDRVVSNYDIAAFLLSPLGAGLAAAGAATSVALLLFELAGLTHLAERRLAGRPATLGEAVDFLLRRSRAIVAMAALICLRLVLIVLPFALAVGIAASAWLGQHDINYYLAERPPEFTSLLRLAAILGIGCALAIGWQLLRWSLALPALAARPDLTAGEALEESARLTRGKLAGILWPLIGWWLLVGLVAGVLLAIGGMSSAAAFGWAGMNLSRVLPVVAVCFATAIVAETLLTGFALAGQQCIVVRGYAERLGRSAGPAGIAAAEPAPSAAALAARAFAVVLSIAAVTTAGAWLALTQLQMQPRVEVTAHRGASIAAPENSLAAFRAALAAGSDWIELDVQRTGDGRVVVLHDADFMRVGGDSRAVGAVTAEDLAGIDIGRRYGAAFAGEHAPLLEKVIALVRGKARLNVELKYNAPDPDLAPAVVELLHRERFLDQAVITSLDYAALRQVEAIEPRAVTGHIVTAALGNVLRTEADFLSVNAAQATVALIRRSHRAGKAVHVWTVNTRDAMLELAARGVDNIITDDPALFARVREQCRALGPSEMLGLRLRALVGRPPEELRDPARIAPL
jgi:glycerophosphoryl diester phosphodiesterase